MSTPADQRRERMVALWGSTLDAFKSRLEADKAGELSASFMSEITGFLRDSGISAETLEEANEVLERYRRAHNRRFARQPKDRKPAWRKPAKGLVLAEVCGFQTTAKVGNDSTVRYQNQVFDLNGPTAASIAGKTVDVCHLLNGQLRLYLDDKRIHQVQMGVPTKAPKRRRKRPPSAATKAKRKKLTFKQIVAKHKTSTKTKVA